MSASDWITLREAAELVGMSLPFVKRLVERHYTEELRDAPGASHRLVNAGQFKAWIDGLDRLADPEDLQNNRRECVVDGDASSATVADADTLGGQPSARRASRARALKLAKMLRLTGSPGRR